MQSVKLCDQTTFFQAGFIQDCESPVNVAFPLVLGSNASTAITPATRENVVSSFTADKGLVFGGLRADVSHFFNPAELTGGCEGSLISTCIVLWEAIYKQSLDDLGVPTFLPDLSNPGVGADNDVDILWKRVSRLPFWGIQLTTIPELSISNQNNPDHIEVRTKRRLSEKEGIFYGFSLIHGTDGSDPCTYTIHTDGWFRVATKKALR